MTLSPFSIYFISSLFIIYPIICKLTMSGIIYCVKLRKCFWQSWCIASSEFSLWKSFVIIWLQKCNSHLHQHFYGISLNNGVTIFTPWALSAQNTRIIHFNYCSSVFNECSYYYIYIVKNYVIILTLINTIFSLNFSTNRKMNYIRLIKSNLL